MIVGRGSLAKLLKDREGAILFASGVGNSRNTDSFQFSREANLLTSNYVITFGIERHLIYFSSIGIFTSESPYFTHKKTMEKIVRDCFDNYTIIRIGNIWECTNPNTFINYLKAHPEAQVRDETKYMISADSLNMICQSLPLKGRHEISIFDEMLTVEECLKRSQSTR